MAKRRSRRYWMRARSERLLAELVAGYLSVREVAGLCGVTRDAVRQAKSRYVRRAAAPALKGTPR